jgi:C-terminal processing protease CtpA/Prc
MLKKYRLLSITLLAMLATACSFNIPAVPGVGAKAAPTTETSPSASTTETTTQPTAEPTKELSAAAGTIGEQPALITGTFKYSNDFVLETYYVEQAVALTDMTGFIKRDDQWVLPVNSQVLGYMAVDTKKKGGTFRLALPQIPEGELNDVSNKGQHDKGVQIFAVAYSPNLVGSPFAVGDDKTRGWPNYLASVVTDTENKNEVTGGKLIVWAPDDKQSFPTGFGTDGLLFTADDPAGPIPAGYSVIDLDQKPFGIIRTPEVTMTLEEPKDVAIKDYSNLSYTESFNKMFDLVKTEYAFNGITGKQPDWDTLYKKVYPMVQAAETNKDANAYFEALAQYEYAFKDGHVGLSGSLEQTYFRDHVGYGYGFAIRELDDGRALVTFLTDGGPAQKAGMKKGAELVQFNGTATKDAISNVQPVLSTYSTEASRRFEQAVYLLRGPKGSKASLTFKNPNEAAKTVSLDAVAEAQSFYAAIGSSGQQDLVPVTYSILPSEIGYIKISSNDDDLGLIVRLFERALKQFESNQVLGLIIDMRHNYGGSPLGLSGYLTDQTITEGQLQYYSDKTKKFEAIGSPDMFYPNETQYHFNKMVLLVGNSCYSACELESYGFSKVPGMQVVGQYGTNGVEAEVARGQFTLPEGISMQIPTGRFVNPDGSIFLEGIGVVPQVKVPITADSVLSSDDATLKAAEDLITKGK